MFLYACGGILLFRSNDPFHFEDFISTFTTLWRMATLDWSSIMYINMVNCSVSNNIIYWGREFGNCSNVPPGKIACVTPELALTPECEALDVVAVEQSTPIMATLYFLSYVILASWIMLSLFMGAVTTAMSSAITQLKAEKNRKKQEEKHRKAEALISRCRSFTT
jgi:voltage-gated sodium channel